MQLVEHYGKTAEFRVIVNDNSTRGLVVENLVARNSFTLMDVIFFSIKPEDKRVLVVLHQYVEVDISLEFLNLVVTTSDILMIFC